MSRLPYVVRRRARIRRRHAWRRECFRRALDRWMATAADVSEPEPQYEWARNHMKMTQEK